MKKQKSLDQYFSEPKLKSRVLLVIDTKLDLFEFNIHKHYVAL